jgi:hypothetical protein
MIMISIVVVAVRSVRGHTVLPRDHTSGRKAIMTRNNNRTTTRWVGNTTDSSSSKQVFGPVGSTYRQALPSMKLAFCSEAIDRQVIISQKRV